MEILQSVSFTIRYLIIDRYWVAAFKAIRQSLVAKNSASTTFFVKIFEKLIYSSKSAKTIWLFVHILHEMIAESGFALVPYHFKKTESE